MIHFETDFVITALKAENSDQVIDHLAAQLHAAGLVDEHYGKATISREREHPTGLPTRPFPIAFPHADATGVHESALALAILKEPVAFRNMADPDENLDAEIVIMLANKSPEEQIGTLRSLAELFGQPEKLSTLKDLTTPDEIVSWMKTELALER